MVASGLSSFTVRAAISASSAETVTLLRPPARFMPIVNSSFMAGGPQLDVGEYRRLIRIGKGKLRRGTRRTIASKFGCRVAALPESDRFLQWSTQSEPAA